MGKRKLACPEKFADSAWRTSRRGLIASAAVAVAGCLYDRRFSLEWTEEVQSQDGRTFVVQIHQIYERLGRSFNRYGGMIVPRDSILTIQPNGNAPVTHLFCGFRPIFLDQYGGDWFGVLTGNYYVGTRKLQGQDWGELEGPYGQWAIKLTNGKWRPISMRELPAVFKEPNMLLLYGTTNEQSALDGKVVTLEEKRKWKTRHPPGYADIMLARPHASSAVRR